MKKFLSYAQELEDLILFNALRDEKNIFYIDVGASDPLALSVTKAFYDRGHHGINVEPSLEEWTNLVEDRPRDINLCVGVGAENGNLVFYKMGTGSTFDSKVSEKAKAQGGNPLEEIIPIITLTEIYEKNCTEGQDIHFCKIDVEGFEREVLLGIDFSKVRPFIFAVESTEPGTDIPSHQEWENILLENGYELAFSHGINRYYADKKKQCFCGKFLPIEELEKIYDIFISRPLEPRTKAPQKTWFRIARECSRLLSQICAIFSIRRVQQ